jgi:hypothetical protein
MNKDFVKICFRLASADWHGSSTETLWAEPLVGTEDAKAFKIENSPFYAKGISYLDVVRAVKRNGQYEFAGVIAHSGHSTYRLLVDPGVTTFEAWWKKLQDLGCTYESGTFEEKKLFTVDVPPTADIYVAYDILEKAEKQDVWLFEEAHVGHKLKDQRLGKAPGLS